MVEGQDVQKLVKAASHHNAFFNQSNANRCRACRLPGDTGLGGQPLGEVDEQQAPRIAEPAATPAAGAPGGMSFSGYGGEKRRQSESHHIDEAGQFPSMFKGFGDHRVGQHHEDGAPGKPIDERLGGSGRCATQQNPPVRPHRRPRR